jgi:hypothetical protein
MAEVTAVSRNGKCCSIYNVFKPSMNSIIRNVAKMDITVNVRIVEDLES